MNIAYYLLIIQLHVSYTISLYNSLILWILKGVLYSSEYVYQINIYIYPCQYLSHISLKQNNATYLYLDTIKYISKQELFAMKKNIEK